MKIPSKPFVESAKFLGKADIGISFEGRKLKNEQIREILEIINDNDVYRGFYSEEFKGCGNGHYYLLFDATHAIFYEDD